MINIASVGGLKFRGPIGIYDITKAALIHLTKHLATELGPKVRVNAIAPGLVKTDFARALWEPHGDIEDWGWPCPASVNRWTSPEPPFTSPAACRRGSRAQSSWSTEGP